MSQQFNIQFVSNITGINPHTIRAWEKRYNAITPSRDNNGRRVYQESDIDRLKRLNALVKSGNAISDIAHLDDENLEAISAKFISPNTKSTISAQDFDFKACMANLSMGLKFFKLDIISHEIAKAASSLSCEDFALKVIAPFLVEIRTAKREGVIPAPARDSIITILRAHIFGKLVKDDSQAKERPLIVLACPKGQLNEVSTLLAALLCQAHNLNFYFLGSQVSASNLAEIVRQFKADLLFLGLRYSVETFSDEEALKYQEELNAKAPAPRTLIGTFDRCVTTAHFECIDHFDKVNQLFKALSLT